MIRNEWLARKVARLEGLNYAGLGVFRVRVEVTKQLEESADIAHVHDRLTL